MLRDDKLWKIAEEHVDDYYPEGLAPVMLHELRDPPGLYFGTNGDPLTLTGDGGFFIDRRNGIVTHFGSGDFARIMDELRKKGFAAFKAAIDNPAAVMVEVFRDRWAGTEPGTYQHWGPNIDEIRITRKIKLADYETIVVTPFDTAGLTVADEIAPLLPKVSDLFIEGLQSKDVGKQTLPDNDSVDAKTLIIRAKVVQLTSGDGRAQTKIEAAIIDAASTTSLVRFTQTRHSPRRAHAIVDNQANLIWTVKRLGQDAANLLKAFEVEHVPPEFKRRDREIERPSALPQPVQVQARRRESAAQKRARKLDSSWERVAEHPRGALIAVRFAGTYRCEETFCRAMSEFLRSAIAEANAAGVIIDLTALDFGSGDDVAGLGALVMPLSQIGGEFRPSAVVASERSARELKWLFEPNIILGVAGMKLYRDRDEALERVKSALG